MKKPNCTPAKITTKEPKLDLWSDKVETPNSNIPPKKERQGPVPPPNYTLEELLAKVPEPTTREPEPYASAEVNTGPPVGKEVW
ncbi:MAG: hypothetical protein OXI24_16080 [Candidatus Poribacteria bacterium]|nr:hypothetical protein [Candidatus Poribacteria bacterium]